MTFGNVAVVGHRGAGKTSLVEAMLFQSGATTRLGSIQNGTTVADWNEDEHQRQMSLSGSICNANWDGRKVNLLDTPGDAGFVSDSLSALRVTEIALIVINGVAGVEVQTTRQWARCEALSRARLVFVNMLDRDRADFDIVVATLQEQLAAQCVPLSIRIGSEDQLSGVHRRAPPARLHGDGRWAGDAGRDSRRRSGSRDGQRVSSSSRRRSRATRP